MAALPLSAEARALRLSAQLAARLARPIGHFDPASCALPPLGPDALGAMAAHPAFRAPINRAASRAAGFDAVPIDADCLARLRTSPRTRLAALLVAQPSPSLREAALSVAAAVIHRRVVTLVLKAERERVRTALGEAAFAVATREAPLLHAPLAEIDDASGTVPLSAAPEALAARLTDLGLSVLARFCAAVEPALAAVFACRLPPGRTEGLAPLAEGHCEHLTRLVRRRMDAWSPTIA